MNIKVNFKEKIKPIAKFFFHWSYFFLLLSLIAYSVYIWKKYIVESDWSEQKKRKYIEEQAVFSFDRKDFEKASELMRMKKEKLEKPEKFSGRDVFSPEGF